MAATTKKTEPQKVPAIRVQTKRDGFRRAGIEWRGEVTIPASEFTDEELEAIRNEPMLVVTNTEMDVEPAEANVAD